MLETIKELIKEAENLDFGEYYLDYVLSVQESALDADVEEARRKLVSISQLNEMEKNINGMIDSL